jgi:hypothetical protein
LQRAERRAGLLALVLGLLHWWLAPDTGTDLAAQLARASFARDAPFTPVDLSWYGGVHPFGYSLLSPWLMALLGVQLAGLLAAVAGSVLLARLLRDTPRPDLAALVGAVFVTADVASGRTTFALGAVAGLAALCARSRRPSAAVLAVLTALLSPVAAAFLGFAAAVLVLHRRTGGWTLGIAATAPVVVLGVLFPGGGVQPYTGHSARPAVLSALVLALLTAVPVVRTAAVLYALAVLAFLAHDDPFGSNALRLGLLVTATVLLATARRRGIVTLAATVGILSWQVGPTWGDLRAPEGPPLGALRTELVALGAHRVEVVAPRDHRESWYVAEEVNLARGWARQQDYVLNPLFYKGTLTWETYLDWLYENAVDHVAVPRRAALDFGSTREGALWHSGAEGAGLGLAPVWQDQHWSVYAVPAAIPVAPGLLSSSRTELRMQLDAGSVDVHVRWSRWLSVDGPACVERVGDQVRLQVRSAGIVTISSSLTPKGHCS